MKNFNDCGCKNRFESFNCDKCRKYECGKNCGCDNDYDNGQDGHCYCKGFSGNDYDNGYDDYDNSYNGNSYDNDYEGNDYGDKNCARVYTMREEKEYDECGCHVRRNDKCDRDEESRECCCKCRISFCVPPFPFRCK